MCGRYAVTTVPEAMRALFRYLNQPNFPARHNIAPTQPVPIVRIFEGKREFALVRWGLIPSWVKDPRGFSLLFNARGESAAEKPAFRNAMKRRRCLFPADGFYEWKQDGKNKQPYFVRLKDGGPMAFAGLWESWMGPNGEEVETAAIVTTAASREIAHIHDRMPVIVPPQAFDFWLDPNVDAGSCDCARAEWIAGKLSGVERGQSRGERHAGFAGPVARGRDGCGGSARAEAEAREKGRRDGEERRRAEEFVWRFMILTASSLCHPATSRRSRVPARHSQACGRTPAPWCYPAAPSASPS
jgi:putative SOS response-associated peptidase YedK